MNKLLSAEIGWVVVMTQPNAEAAAEKSLEEAGYRVYLPRYRRVLRPHGEARSGKPVMRPAFTGYLFAQDWRGWPKEPVRGAIGLMMKPGGVPVVIAASDIDTIWQRERSGVFDDQRMSARERGRRLDLAVGDSVACQWHGERIEGILDSLSDNGRAVIRTILFNGRETPLTIAAERIEKSC